MATALLVETVTGATTAELIAARDAVTRADMVELRLDGVIDLDVVAALRGRRVPVIATCRPEWEGGRFRGDEGRRREILREAFAAGAEYVDVEWRAGFSDLIEANASRAVVSSHDFTGVPADVAGQARAMRQTGAAVIKVAVTATRLRDALPLVEIARDGNAVVIAMGDAGVSSRLLASRFGSRWTYAGNAVAPGQMPTARMLDEFRFRAVGSDTAVYGVVSSNVSHSLSPVMHNAAFGAAGLDAVYVPLAAADFADFLAYADALGVSGASVTIPFKIDAFRAARQSDDRTRAVGAANTLRRMGGGPGADWEATNTDVDGFLDPIDAMYPGSLLGARAAVLGGGGAARAVVVALETRGAHVSVHARRAEQAREVITAVGGIAGPWPPAPGSWDVLVNCTPLGGPTLRGMTPLPGGPFDGRLVYDLTYGPDESPLLREARAAGCLTLDGLPMLVAQAGRQFEWWTGQRPRAGVMRQAVETRIAEMESASARN